METMKTVKVDATEKYGLALFADMGIDRVFANSIICIVPVFFDPDNYTELLEHPRPGVWLGTAKVAYQNGVALAECLLEPPLFDPGYARAIVLSVARDYYTTMGKCVANIKIVAAGAVLYTADDVIPTQKLAVSHKIDNRRVWHEHPL